jgi:hypothetical protein
VTYSSTSDLQSAWRSIMLAFLTTGRG